MSTVKKPETAKVEAKAADKVETVKTTAKTEPAKKAEAPKAEPAKKAEAPKAEPVKKAEAPKAAKKAEPAKKAEAPKAVKKAEPAKKAEAPKAVKKAEPAKKAEAPKAAKKPAAKKAVEEIYIEFNGAKVATADIVAKVVEATGKKASSIKVLNVYIQPETGKTYYTVDGEGGEIEFLF